jgi:hypothetical protein
MQKSQIGLFRTLLWRCLSEMPTIAPLVCPRRWALHKVFGPQAAQAAPEWSWAELMESFSLMLPLIGDSFRLALFIDGLDEFEGTHEKLIAFVNLFRAQPGAKICVSSRPWNVFQDAFRSGPSLKMEDITNKDIELFVKSRFSQTPSFIELEQIMPQDASKLVEGIVTKAKGVFLWVSVVVNALCEGLTEGDKLSDLQAELDRLPSDLEQLYSSIWLGVKGKYIAHSSQLFQIIECSTQQLDVVTLSLADDDNALDQNINEMTKERRKHIDQIMRRRLNSRTRGLLEVSPAGQVDYLHRSVRDWTIEKWPEIRSAAPDFDANLALLKALAVEASRAETWRNSLMSLPTEFWSYVCLCMYHASKVKDNAEQADLFVKVMDRLDVDLGEVSTGYPLFDGTLPLYRDTGSSKVLLHSGQELPHWASTQRTQTSGTLSISFLGLSSEFAVLPYVKKKILQDPELLRASRRETPVLECAVYGFEHFCRPDIADVAERYIVSSRKTRLELVNFLLEKGGLHRWKDDSRTSQSRDYAKSIKDHAHQRVKFLRDVSDADPHELRYWQDIELRMGEALDSPLSTQVYKKGEKDHIFYRFRSVFKRN